MTYFYTNLKQESFKTLFMTGIVKILNLYIILFCDHLNHFFPVSIHSLQSIQYNGERTQARQWSCSCKTSHPLHTFSLNVLKEMLVFYHYNVLALPLPCCVLCPLFTALLLGFITSFTNFSHFTPLEISKELRFEILLKNRVLPWLQQTKVLFLQSIHCFLQLYVTRYQIGINQGLIQWQPCHTLK